MQKFLVIGLGGSGGKTLGFLMDELRFSLGSEWGSERLPACWQFLHIDVPTAVDAHGRSLASTVPSQGGRYVGLADSGASYGAVDSVVFERLKNTHPQTQSHMARWRPKGVAIAIGGGAGASRGIGRVVTLSQSARIVSEIQQVIAVLNSTEASNDLARIKAQLGSSSTSPSNSKPMVIMVSSMAGGSGASMVLDVADLLRGLTNDSTFDGDHTSAFLYTSEVFGGLTANTAAGTLATISELQAAMLRKNDHWTEEEWSILGTNTPRPQGTGRGPFSIFPVGAKSHGVGFGNSAEDVYRGFSKMLAPILLKESLQVKLQNYVQVNGPADAVSNPDNSRITELVQKGYRADVDYAHFMGWGSATLTTGRKRYLEYVSQRVAREAARILVEGHGVDASVVSNPAQKKREMASNFVPGFMQGLPLGADLSGNVTAKGLLSAAYSETDSTKMADAFAQQLSAVFTQSGASGGASVAPLLGLKLRAFDDSMKQARLEAMQVLTGWAGDLQMAMENEYLRVASIKGLEIANLVLDEAKRRILSAATAEMSTLLSVAAPPFGAIANQQLALIQKIGKAAVGPGAKPALQFLQSIRGSFNSQLRREIAQELSGIASDFVAHCAGSLERSGESLLRQLISEMEAAAQNFTTAAYREAPISDWPQNEHVPSHFEPAVNEVMLDSVESFPSHFWAHLEMTVEGISGAREQFLAAAAQEVILGAQRMRDDNGRFRAFQGWRVNYQPSHEFIGRRSNWLPRELAIYTPQASVTAASYLIDFLPAALLDKARHWVERPGVAYSDFADVGIRDWTYPPASAGLDPKEISQRETIASNKLMQAVNFAAPLVEIDALLLQKVHESGASGLKYEFSEIPFTEADKIIQTLQSTWMGNSTAGHNTDAVKNSLNPSSDQTEVVIFSTFAAPYAIPVFQSLTGPIRAQWLQAKSSGATAGFWKNRRARPLRDYVPMSRGAFQAFVTGWIVGRISGSIRIEDNPFKPGFKKVLVYSDSQSKWLEFPADPDLLGVNGLGVKAGSDAIDVDGWNIPPALLESFPLALANCQGQDLSALDPYWHVVDLGLSLKSIGKHFGSSPLQNFLEGSKQPHGQVSQLSRFSGQGDRASRERAVTDYLHLVGLDNVAEADGSGAKSSMASLLLSRKLSTIQELEGLPRSFEIAQELIRACVDIQQEVEWLAQPHEDEESEAPAVPIDEVEA